MTMVDMETEGQVAYEQGFGMYEVREDYVIRDDRLWPQGEIKYTYAPMLHPELIGEITKLTWGDNKAVLRFARQYGLLGYHHVIDAILERHTYPRAEDHEIWQRRLPGPKGEPLHWIWAHANTINACLTLTSLLQAGDETALQSYFDTWHGPIIQFGFDSTHPDYLMEALKDGGFVKFPIEFPELGITENAKLFRREIVNANIGPIRRGIWDLDGKGEKSYYSVQGTVRAAYWHLATLIETGTHRLLRCKDPKCQAWFAQKDPRQHFCPAPMGMKESRCSARYRMRARRANKGEGHEA